MTTILLSHSTMYKFFFSLVHLALFVSHLSSQKPDRSFDLNRTASSENGLLHIDMEEEVQSRHHPPFTEVNNQTPGTSKMNRPNYNLLTEEGRKKPLRFYAKGVDLSGKTKDGKCGIHSEGCEHWDSLDHETKRIHKSRLTQRRYRSNEHNRKKEAERNLSRYYQLTFKERQKLAQVRKEREHERFSLLPAHLQEEKRIKKAEYGRNWKLRSKLKITNG